MGVGWQLPAEHQTRLSWHKLHVMAKAVRWMWGSATSFLQNTLQNSAAHALCKGSIRHSAEQQSALCLEGLSNLPVYHCAGILLHLPQPGLQTAVQRRPLRPHAAPPLTPPCSAAPYALMQRCP